MNTTLVNTQIDLEIKYNKNQLMSKVIESFKTNPWYEETMLQNQIDFEFGYEVLAHIYNHRRANVPTMVGCLRHIYNDSQKTADMLMQCVIADLLDWSADEQVFIIKWDLVESIKQEIETYQFPLPLVVPPRIIKKNHHNGYYKSKGSLILKNNYHTDDICIDHINRVNQIPLVLNMNTATFVKNKWRNLDKKKIGETYAEFEERKRAFNTYDKVSFKVMREINALSDHFYLTHKYDFRGRTYDQGYHVNYQGNDWNKAVVEFFDKEIIED